MIIGHEWLSCVPLTPLPDFPVLGLRSIATQYPKHSACAWWYCVVRSAERGMKWLYLMPQYPNLDIEQPSTPMPDFQPACIAG